MRKLLKRTAGILVAGLLAALPAQTQAETLKVAALTGWAPFSGENLLNKGFSNDVVKTALERLGHEAEVEVMPWARALAMTETGRFDVLPSVWHSKERAEKLVFADRIATNRIVFMKRAGDSFTFNSLEDLDGKLVGTVQGYSYREDFLNAESFTRESTSSLLTNLRKLLGKRIDLTLGDELVTRYTINQELPDQADQIVFTDGALSSKPLHVTISRQRDDAEALAESFNAELEEMRADGTYDAILARHGLK